MNQRRLRPAHEAAPRPASSPATGPLSVPDRTPFDSRAYAHYGHRLALFSPSAPVLQRQAEGDTEGIQMKAEGAAPKRPDVAAASGGGSPLPAPIRGKMERSFGHSFADVRIHSGGEAGAVGALAYTRGTDIHFQPDLYAPDSLSGQELLGHELTHVIQQKAGRVSSPQSKAAGAAPINDDAGLEAEADALGARAARGETANVSGAGSGTQRKADPDAPIQCKGSGIFSRLKRLFRKGDAPQEDLVTHINPLWQGATATGRLAEADPEATAPASQAEEESSEAPHPTTSADPLSASAPDVTASVPQSVPASPPPLLPGILPGAQYKDEDKKYGWRAAIDPNLMAQVNDSNPETAAAALAKKGRAEERTDIRVTKYLTPEQQAKHAVSTNDAGLLTRQNGKLLDTKKGVGGGINPAGGTELFVMGTDGGLYAADAERQSSVKRQNFLEKQAQLGVPKPAAQAAARRRNKPDEIFHHTSFLAGGEVAGAGEIRAKQGRVTEISDQSGHYKPKAEATFNTVTHMAKPKAEGGLGISMLDDTPDASGHAVNRPVGIRLGGKPGLGNQEINLTHQQFLQTGGNEEQIRTKMALLPEIDFYRGDQGVGLGAAGNVDAGPALKPSLVSGKTKARRNDLMPEWMQQLPAHPRSVTGGGAYGWLGEAAGFGDDASYLSKRTPYSTSYVGAEGALDADDSDATGRAKSPYGDTLMDDEPASDVSTPAGAGPSRYAQALTDAEPSSDAGTLMDAKPSRYAQALTDAELASNETSLMDAGPSRYAQALTNDEPSSDIGALTGGTQSAYSRKTLEDDGLTQSTAENESVDREVPLAEAESHYRSALVY